MMNMEVRDHHAHQDLVDAVVGPEVEPLLHVEFGVQPELKGVSEMFPVNIAA